MSSAVPKIHVHKTSQSYAYIAAEIPLPVK